MHAALRKLLPGAIQSLNQKVAGASIAMARPAVASTAQVRAPWGPNKPGYVYFYQSGQPYYEFTNFYGSPITIDGKLWPTSEHYFQAQKYPARPDLQERIRKAASPREAFNITREPANDPFKARDWDTSKFNAMLKAVRAKFSHSPLKNVLLGTGNAVLVENAGANDAVWGAGTDFMGINHLGRILMRARDELYSGKQKPYVP